MPFFYISAPYLFKLEEATIKEIKETVCRKGLAEGRELKLDRRR